MIELNMRELSAEFTDAAGKPIKMVQQVRTDPVTLKHCRITPSRALENERGTDKMHQPPDADLDKSNVLSVLEILSS